MVFPIIEMLLFIIIWSGILVALAGLGLLIYGIRVQRRALDRRPVFGRWLIIGGSGCIVLGTAMMLWQMAIF